MSIMNLFAMNEERSNREAAAENEYESLDKALNEAVKKLRENSDIFAHKVERLKLEEGTVAEFSGLFDSLYNAMDAITDKRYVLMQKVKRQAR